MAAAAAALPWQPNRLTYYGRGVCVKIKIKTKMYLFLYQVEFHSRKRQND